MSSQPTTNFTQTKKRIRKRPVHFGNPALVTYTGYVYTVAHNDEDDEDGENNGMIEDTEDDSNNTEKYETFQTYPNDVNKNDWETHENQEQASLCETVVAIVGVPPEQIPEDLWNFVRVHVNYIRHVRILTLPPSTSPSTSTSTSTSTSISTQQGGKSAHSKPEKKCLIKNENEKKEDDEGIPKHSSIITENNDSNAFTNNPMESSPFEIPTTSPTTTSYLVLFQLDSKESVNEFISDLHGKPFTFLQTNVVCNAYKVVPPLLDENGYSLMNPFFDSTDVRNRGPSGSSNSSQISHAKKKGPPEVIEHYRHSNEPTNCAVCLDILLVKPTNTTPTCRIITTKSQRTTKTTTSTSTSLPHPNQPILTTVCNHSFHMECLLRWQDSPCPVCRYDHSGINETLSQCHICGTTENTYVCLICGVVSCGMGHSTTSTNSITTTSGAQRASSSQNGYHPQNYPPPSMDSHAREHYNSTLHAYAFQTQTQHVWDFAGDGYVHRLVSTVSGQTNTSNTTSTSSSNFPSQSQFSQPNHQQGQNQQMAFQPTKMVEIHDPYNTTREDRSTIPSYLSDRHENEVVHRKLEDFASEYYSLLKEQLDQQRDYYQQRLKDMRHQFVKKHSFNDSRNRYRGETTADLIWALKQERNQLEQRMITMKLKCQKVNQDVEFLRHMNEGLETNKPAMERQIRMVQREREEAKEMVLQYIPALEEKVKMLMLKLDGSGSENSSSSVVGGCGDANLGQEAACLDDKKPPSGLK